MDELNLWMTVEVLWVKKFDRIVATYIIIGKVYHQYNLKSFRTKNRR